MEGSRHGGGADRPHGRNGFVLPVALVLALVLLACSDAEPLLFAAPDRILIESPGLDHGQVGEGFTAEITIRVVDREGRGVPGVTVSLSASTPGATLERRTLRTDGNGRATVPRWTLGRETGLQRLEARVAGLRPAFVEVQALPGTPGSLSFVGPAPNRIEAGDEVRGLPRILVRDRFGHRVPGAEVQLSVTGGGTLARSLVLTDDEGEASLPAWEAGTTVGVHTLMASVGDDVVQRLHIEVVAGPAAGAVWRLEFEGAVDAGLFVPGDPALLVTDVHGNPVPGHPVRFEVLSGEGFLVEPDLATGGDGLARPGRWTLGSGPAPQRLEARPEGLPAQRLEVPLADPALPPEGFHFRVEGAHVNQGSQTMSGEIPLVAGRPGLLRVWVSASRAAGPLPDVRARLHLPGGQVIDTLLAPPAFLETTPAEVTSDAGTPAWSLVLPASWIGPGLRIEAEVDPEHRIGVNSRRLHHLGKERDGIAPGVEVLEPFRIRFIPLRDNASGLEGRIDEANAHHFMSATRRMLPLADDRISVGPPLHLDLIDASGRVTVALPELRAAWAVSAFRDHYVHGIFSADLPRRFFGVAYRPADPSRPAPIGQSYDRLPQAAGTVAHELGHNMGLGHAPCGDPMPPDLDGGLREGGTIGYPGWDLQQGRLVSPSSHRDFMGYCQPRWPSDRSFDRMLRWRLAAPFGTPTLATPAVAASPGLLLWGRSHAGGIELEPALPVEAPALVPAGAGGSHRALGIDRRGRVLFDFRFEPDAVPHAPDPTERHFAFVIPLDPGALASLGELRVEGPGGAAVRVVRPGAFPDAPPAGARLLRSSPAGGGVERLSWDPAVLPLAVARDPETGEIRGFFRSGEVALEGELASMEFLFSDGVRGWRAAPDGSLGPAGG